MIKKKVGNPDIFSFNKTTCLEIEKEIKVLNPKKASTHGNIPTKILKQSVEACKLMLTNIFNKSIEENEFPDNLKFADVTPIYKKDDPNNPKNYRPVSVLPVTSKIFERILQKQLVSHINQFLSPFLCGYRKGFSAQQALLTLVEKWKKSLDKRGFGGALLMDLSKAFDTINHELLLAKLEAYGFSKSSLKLLQSYLSSRWQRTKVNGSFSNWSELLLGVPQGSVLGPLLFNIYINDLFYLAELTDISNYADDTTFYACDADLKNLVRRLEHDSELAIDWFENNYMKLNPDKCHFLISGYKHESLFANIGDSKILESPSEKLLGVIIDRSLKFDEHVFSICKKAGRKLSALSRVSKFLSFAKKRILMKSFVESQFNYCPLVWMFCGRKANNRINNIHERALRLVYNDEESSFEELLIKDNSVTIHERNIRLLAIEVFKIRNKISTESMCGLLESRNLTYNLRSQTDFSRDNVNSTSYGIKSMSFLGPKIWNILPHELKTSRDLTEFKEKIKSWVPRNCPCKLCDNYIQHIGYLDVS